LLQFAIERFATIPIYVGMVTVRTIAEMDMQSEAILKFLADSRHYLGN
jgi:hypothetical protein